MGLVYFLTVVPTGLILKLFGKDPMRRKFDSKASSYWIPREKNALLKDDFDNQFWCVDWFSKTVVSQEYWIQFVMDLIKELWRFMKARKKFWLLPIIIFSLLIGGLVVFAEGSALAPFIYTLF